MSLDAFLEAFSVSDVTIIFLLSLGIGLMPKLGGAIGLDDPVGVWCALGLELCMLDWGGGKGMAVLCILDWGGGKGVAVLCMLYWYGAHCIGIVHLGWMRSVCWSSMVHLGWMRSACTWAG